MKTSSFSEKHSAWGAVGGKAGSPAKLALRSRESLLAAHAFSKFQKSISSPDFFVHLLKRSSSHIVLCTPPPPLGRRPPPQTNHVICASSSASASASGVASPTTQRLGARVRRTHALFRSRTHFLHYISPISFVTAPCFSLPSASPPPMPPSPPLASQALVYIFGEIFLLRPPVAGRSSPHLNLDSLLICDPRFGPYLPRPQITANTIAAQRNLYYGSIKVNGRNLICAWRVGDRFYGMAVGMFQSTTVNALNQGTDFRSTPTSPAPELVTFCSVLFADGPSTFVCKSVWCDQVVPHPDQINHDASTATIKRLLDLPNDLRINCQGLTDLEMSRTFPLAPVWTAEHIRQRPFVPFFSPNAADVAIAAATAAAAAASGPSSTGFVPFAQDATSAAAAASGPSSTGLVPFAQNAGSARLSPMATLFDSDSDDESSSAPASKLARTDDGSMFLNFDRDVDYMSLNSSGIAAASASGGGFGMFSNFNSGAAVPVRFVSKYILLLCRF